MMSKYSRNEFKYYKVTYPNGKVTDVSLHRSVTTTFAEELIKRVFSMKDHKTGKTLRPVKVKRTK
jgi:hypothetical protein